MKKLAEKSSWRVIDNQIPSFMTRIQVNYLSYYPCKETGDANLGNTRHSGRVINCRSTSWWELPQSLATSSSLLKKDSLNVDSQGYISQIGDSRILLWRHWSTPKKVTSDTVFWSPPNILPVARYNHHIAKSTIPYAESPKGIDKQTEKGKSNSKEKRNNTAARETFTYKPFSY